MEQRGVEHKERNRVGSTCTHMHADSHPHPSAQKPIMMHKNSWDAGQHQECPPRLSTWASRRSWRCMSCLRASLSASLCLSSCRHLCCRAWTSVSLHTHTKSCFLLLTKLCICVGHCSRPWPPHPSRRVLTHTLANCQLKQQHTPWSCSCTLIQAVLTPLQSKLEARQAGLGVLLPNSLQMKLLHRTAH